LRVSQQTAQHGNGDKMMMFHGLVIIFAPFSNTVHTLFEMVSF
jgi:hypothetical protein